MKKIIVSFALVFIAFSVFALPSANKTTAPSKRGICYNSFSQQEIDVLEKSNVSWGYNWYQSSGSERIGPEQNIEFMPMIWGAGEDFDDMVKRTREYLSEHKNVRCILGFNEPMMKGQYGGCDLTPKEAAKKWPVLEKIAADFDVLLAGPALTWGFEPLSDGKIYGAPEEWMDEFIRQYKKMNRKREPRFDFLVLHSYMDYPSAVMWFCSTYAARYGKKVMLTEFCAWDQDPNQKPHQSLWEQTVAMSQKVEAMDSEDCVESYAWFMSHAAVNEVPFNSVFSERDSDGKLTELGAVYLNMVDVSKKNVFSQEEVIPAFKYASSSNYNKTVGTKCDDGVRFNTPVGLALATDNSNQEIFNDIPLELSDFSNKRFASYMLNLPETRTYKMKLRLLTDNTEIFTVSSDGTELAKLELSGTNGEWKTVELNVPLEKGTHEILIKSLGNARKVKFYWFAVD